jgi:hypothetical protein
MRWGTNRVAEVHSSLSFSNTWLFSTRFSIAGSPHEAQAAVGDSGGGVFARGDDGWELAGVMIAVDSYPGQPARTTFYGNRTFHADLSHYADEIDRILAAPPGTSTFPTPSDSDDRQP